MHSTSNLLQETIDIMAEHDKRPEDVHWIGDDDGKFSLSWEMFAAIADFEYNNVEGGAQIAMDLVVVGENWWLERHDAEGAQWWEFKTLPQRQKTAKPFSNLIGLFVLLADINSDQE